MKITKDELLSKVREHGGETPDDFTISLLEDIADSVDNLDTSESDELRGKNEELGKTITELQSAYDSLKKAYADRFTLKNEEVNEVIEESEEPKEEIEGTETYESIF